LYLLITGKDDRIARIAKRLRNEEGLSLRKIGEQLKFHGRSQRNGKTWNASTVKRLLATKVPETK